MKTGLRSQETLNCDHINILRTCKCDTITTRSINSPVIESLVQRILSLEERVSALESTQGNVFTAGETVSTSLHFSDLDITDPSFDVDAFTAQLAAQIAAEAGVDPSQVNIIDLASTGSATATIEVVYENSTDESVQQQIQDSKNNLLEVLSDPLKSQDMLADIGDVEVEQTSTGPIQSMNRKILVLQNRLNAEHISFQNSKSIILNDYNINIDDNTLKVRRFDHDTGSYVGGMLDLG